MLCGVTGLDVVVAGFGVVGLSVVGLGVVGCSVVVAGFCEVFTDAVVLACDVVGLGGRGVLGCGVVFFTSGGRYVGGGVRVVGFTVGGCGSGSGLGGCGFDVGFGGCGDAGLVGWTVGFGGCGGVGRGSGFTFDRSGFDGFGSISLDVVQLPGVPIFGGRHWHSGKTPIESGGQ